MKIFIFSIAFASSFVLLSAQQVDSIIDIRDDQIYKVVKIDQQWWMQENLNAGTRINGTQNPFDNGTIEKYCYDDQASNCDIYGGLYLWDEMMDYNPTDNQNPGITQGICPLGWHLPTDSEWTELTDLLGGESVAGGKMKEAGTDHWVDPNFYATNESGFTALPGGHRLLNGTYGSLTATAYFWSSTESTNSVAWRRSLNFQSGYVSHPSSDKKFGFSVRCLRDSSQFSYLTVSDKNLKTVSNLIFTIDQPIDTIIIINSSAGKTVNISSMHTDGTTYNLNKSSSILSSGDIIYVIVTFSPPGFGYFTDSMCIISDDPYNPLIHIPLSGGLYETDSIIDIRDGQVYKIVKIGQDWWMKENLNIGKRIDGTQDPADNDTIEKYCYSDLESNCDIYGGLYQWNEMMDYNLPDYGPAGTTRGICPLGWHVPTQTEWLRFVDSLGGSSLAGGKLKEIGYSHWNYPNIGATNESGFTALPGGCHDYGGSFYSIGDNAYFWSSYAGGGTARYLQLDKSNTEGTDLSRSQFDAVSVRCLKDPEPLSYLTIRDTNFTTVSELSFYYDDVKDTLYLINTGAGNTINISSIHTAGQAFDLNRSDAVLNPGDSIHLTVTFTPPEKDIYQDTLFIESDDPFAPLISIPLLGTYPPEIIFTEINNVSCHGLSDGSMTIAPVLGTPPYNIKWFNSLLFTDSVLSGLVANTKYWVTVTDSRGWTVTDTAMLTEPEPLTIVSGYPDTICLNSNDGIINCNPEGGTPPYHYDWSTGDTVPSLTGLETGEYDVKVTDSHGCVDSADITIHPAVPYEGERICIVTVDLASGKNLVVWEKTYGKGTEQYKIYRDGNPIGSVPFNDLSVFLDSEADPEKRSYVYQLTVVDTCGNESTLSPYHQPHFLQFVSSEGGVILSWSEYEVEGGSIDFNNYTIYRGSDSTALAPLEENIPITIDRYTDNDPTALIKKYYYRVAGNLTDPCFPSGAGSKKADAGPYSHSMSNIEDNRLQSGGIDREAQNTLKLYPNPFSQTTTLRFTNPEKNSYTLYVTDISGKVCRVIMDIATSEFTLEKGGLKPGIYFIELRGPEIYRGKVIVE